MFSRIQASGYRCLRYVDQQLDAFQALVGPNASGKTTFLDVIGFLGELVRNEGRVDETIRARSQTFRDLLFKGEGNSFEIAVEAKLPQEVRSQMRTEDQRFDSVRYELGIGLDGEGAVGVNYEVLWYSTSSDSHHTRQRALFPDPAESQSSLFVGTGRSRRKGISNDPLKNVKFYPDGKQTYRPMFKLGRETAALAVVPADRESYVAAPWFKEVLTQGTRSVVLNSEEIKTPSPPGLPLRFRPDGSNLPHVIDNLKRKHPDAFSNWLDHVRTALPDIRDIQTHVRDEDLFRYFRVEYSDGTKVPSWLVSDGSLRLLALTILAYLPDVEGVYLIEEPENGIHPQGIETVFESLSSVHKSQVLVATHSIVALNQLDAAHVLCFAKADGATDIVRGSEHPRLKEWRAGAPELGVLFATGVLG